MDSVLRLDQTFERGDKRELRLRVDAVRFSGAVVEEMVDPDVLETASRAVHDRTTMRFDHGDPATSRHVEPHGLVARGGRWYLVAWDLDRRDWRIFRLDRMTPSRTPGPRFTPRAIPTGEAATFTQLGNTVVDKQAALALQVMDRLDQRLQERIGKLQRSFFTEIAISVAFVAMAAYLLLSFYKVVMGGLHVSAMPNEALQHADAVVTGGAEGAWPRVVADAGSTGVEAASRTRWPAHL